MSLVSGHSPHCIPHDSVCQRRKQFASINGALHHLLYCCEQDKTTANISTRHEMLHKNTAQCCINSVMNRQPINPKSSVKHNHKHCNTVCSKICLHHKMQKVKKSKLQTSKQKSVISISLRQIRCRSYIFSNLKVTENMRMTLHFP